MAAVKERVEAARARAAEVTASVEAARATEAEVMGREVVVTEVVVRAKEVARHRVKVSSSSRICRRRHPGRDLGQRSQHCPQSIPSSRNAHRLTSPMGRALSRRMHPCTCMCRQTPQEIGAKVREVRGASSAEA